MVKSAIINYWIRNLINQTVQLPSLQYLRVNFLSLGFGPHPVWWTCGSSPSAVHAATIQAKMIFGRYRSCWLRRHQAGGTGACKLPGCGKIPGDVAHLISDECASLQPQLSSTLVNILDFLSPYPQLQLSLVSGLNGDRESITRFILDPSTDPTVMVLCKTYGKTEALNLIFRASCSRIWAAHRTRLRLLGLENFLM